MSRAAPTSNRVLEVWTAVAAAFLIAAFVCGFALMLWSPSKAAGQPLLRPDQISALRGMVTQAQAHGLPARAYEPPGLDALLDSPDPDARDRGQALLLEAGASFASAIRQGRLATADFRPDWAIRPAPYDGRADLARALAANDLGQWIRSAPPPHPGYAALVQALARYRRIEAAGGWPALGLRSPLRPGADSADVGALRRRLALEGIGLQPTDAPNLYDSSLAGAVMQFQRQHGLGADGFVGPATVRALDVPVEARTATIVANLERWRWVPRILPDTRVEVNIAAAELRAYDSGRLALSMRTVVGRPADPSPMFGDQIESVVFNPPWNVPAVIAAKEILPRAARDPGYLAREGFVFIRDGSGARLQQRPGPTSALGLFKFDLPNAFSVYLHDTPGRTVFARDVRTLSHGCIRLERPRDLAVWLLGRDGFDPARIDAAVAAGVTSTQALTRPVPVYLIYWTAFVDEEGAIQFRDDPYGWDRLVLARLR